jgi:hypothetical protein
METTLRMNLDERRKYLRVQRVHYLAANRTGRGLLLDEMEQVTLSRPVIKFPTLAKWLRSRHNGTVSRNAEEWITYAECGDTLHDQGSVPQGPLSE